MKEDVLEQILDDYLMHLGYFTRHNLRFKPSPNHSDFARRDDSVASDIDVIGINPLRESTDRVWVVSCKSWQTGFDPSARIASIKDKKIVSGRAAWKGFRELCVPKWSAAFLDTIETTTGSREFTYVTVVTRLSKPTTRHEWENNPEFRAAIEGNPIKILTLEEMLSHLWGELTETPAASEIGRAIQLMKAAKWTPPTRLA